ncbi:universal stress protein [Streptomyces sp. NBC_00829]|uniref:universal stress protein n=1 Tax=Streptomyces sp. NBC_00829 TaxID=2903679 RepID=UPI0038637609|nr:universal stress protein [Streptomyces sp. NBC_00829]
MHETVNKSCGRVVVGVSGGSCSLTALHRAAAEARIRDAELWVVLAWQPVGGQFTRRTSPMPSLYAGCRSVAVERLRGILDTAFGAVKPGVTLAGMTVCGTAGAALVNVARHSQDLLVVGTGRGRLRRLLRPSVARYCFAHAPCPVLTVPPSPLEADLAAAHRRNVWRIPLDTRKLAE